MKIDDSLQLRPDASIDANDFAFFQKNIDRVEHREHFRQHRLKVEAHTEKEAVNRRYDETRCPRPDQ